MTQWLKALAAVSVVLLFVTPDPRGSEDPFWPKGTACMRYIRHTCRVWVSR